MIYGKATLFIDTVVAYPKKLKALQFNNEKMFWLSCFLSYSICCGICLWLSIYFIGSACCSRCFTKRLYRGRCSIWRRETSYKNV